MSVRDASSANIKKLTKRKKATGELYKRRSEVELQIGNVLTLKNDRITELLKNRHRDSADYLLDETIVYLLREPGVDRNFLENLYTELNHRIWKLFKKFYPRFKNPSDFQDFGQQVETVILRKILDTDTDAADYAQVNFGDFVVKTAKVAWRGELVRIESEKEIFYTGGEIDDDDNLHNIENIFKSGEAPADYTLMLKEGVNQLPPHIMLVAELLLDGWQIESKDEREPTISKKLKVSSRTIRNWLKEARAILATYKAEERR